MEIANSLVARVCHDLITPFNAINLGLDTYEMTNDKELLVCIKESTVKANAVLTFIRELFADRSHEYFYSRMNLNKMINEFLKHYNISASIKSSDDQISYHEGKIIMHMSMIAKEILPFGGKISCNNDPCYMRFLISGDHINALELNDKSEINYRTVIRYSLMSVIKLTNMKIQQNQTEKDLDICIEK